LLKIIITLLIFFFQTGNCQASDENCYPEAPFLDSSAFECNAVPFLYDWDKSSPEFVNNNATVYVLGGVLDKENNLVWQVYSSGVTFSNGKTTINGGRSQTLFADDTACGYIIITVTDGCGNTVNSGVRAKGKWIKISWNDSIAMKFLDLEPDEYTEGYNCGPWSNEKTAIKTLGDYKLFEYMPYVRSDYYSGTSPYFYYKHMPPNPHTTKDCGLTFQQACFESRYGGCLKSGSVPEPHDLCIPYYLEDYEQNIMIPPPIYFYYGSAQVGGKKGWWYGSYGANSLMCSECASGAASYYVYAYYHACTRDGKEKGQLWQWTCP